MLRPNHLLSESVYVGDVAPNTQHWGAIVDNALIAGASLYRETLPEIIIHEPIYRVQILEPQ